MVDLLEVGNQKQLTHYYRTFFQEDQNECLQKLLYIQNITSLCSVFPTTNKKSATSLFWQYTLGRAKKLYMTNC